MKKVLWSLVLVIGIFVITGCGSNSTLNCSKDFSSSMQYGVSMVQDSKIEFKNNKIESMEMIMKFEVPSTLSSQFDTLMNKMKTTYDNMYAKYDGITVRTNKTGSNTFEVVISIDYKNISDTTKKAIGAVGSESYSVNRRQLENQGYTCK